MSALTKIANGEHRKVTASPNDYVIISATPIPGNEKMVSNVVNELMKRDIEVIYENMYEVHVSGHACQEELKLMMGVIKPKFFFPVHGEQKHLKKHAKLAEAMGISKKNIFIGDIGKHVEITEKGIKTLDNVPSGDVYVDGIGVGDVGNIVLNDRKHLSADGIIIIVATIDSQTGEVLSGPDIVSRGFVYVRESEELIASARDLSCRIIEETYNSVLPYLSHTNGIQYLKTEDIPISIHMNGIKADFDEPRITTDADANHKVIWDCVFYKVEKPSVDVPSLHESIYFKAEACDELYRLIGEEPPKRYEGIQAVNLPPEIAKKVDLTLKFIDTEDYESSVRVVSKIDEIKGRISSAEADMENLKDIKPNLWNKVFRHSEVKKREISSANLRNNKIELEQVYDELNKITQKMMCENFEDDSENRTTKESIEIDYPEEKSLDENMDFNQLSSFLDNEEEEQDEVLDLTSKSGRSL